VVAFIKPHQPEPIRKILEHCGRWHDLLSCAPPEAFLLLNVRHSSRVKGRPELLWEP